MQQIEISESRRKKGKKKGKKKGSARSQMLKAVMPKLSSVDGKILTNAIQEQNSEKFRQAWIRIGNTLAKELEEDE